jgi:hypothetical protein
MKKMVLLLTLVVFMLAVPLAMAAEKPAAPPAADKVNCCTAGKCAPMPKADCEKGGGKVVKDCKDCKLSRPTPEPNAGGLELPAPGVPSVGPRWSRCGSGGLWTI